MPIVSQTLECSLITTKNSNVWGLDYRHPVKRESPPVQINDIYSNLHDITCRLSPCKTRVYLVEGLDGGGGSGIL